MKTVEVRDSYGTLMAVEADLDPTLKSEWVTALRSGEYTQGKNYLQTEDGGYCCLGVLVCVKEGVKNLDTGLKYPEGATTAYLGLPWEVQRQLADFNDNTEKGFAGIADWIEEKL